MVKIWFDAESKAYGIRDKDDMPLVNPIFSSERNVRRYIKEMGWVLLNDDLKQRYNSMVFTVKSKYKEFEESQGQAPNYVLLSEYCYNTLQMGDYAMKIDVVGGRETQTCMGMKILVDRDCWDEKILVGLMF